MIRFLRAQNFRMLKGNQVELRRFNVLVGQNATGKSTLLGAMQLISGVLGGGVTQAVRSMAPSFFDLCFERDLPIAFAVGLTVPANPGDEAHFRYELEIGLADGTSGHLRVLRENLFLCTDGPDPPQPSLFPPAVLEAPCITERAPRTWRKIVSKTAEGRDYFQDEKTDWNNMFRFGADKTALGSLPEDPERFALSIAARDLLRDGVRLLELDSRKLRHAAPPGGTDRLALDGSNLPYVVQELKARDPVLFREWVQHLSTGVLGLADVDVWERPEDKHLVLTASFEGRHSEPVPAWLLSDGTLRLMALTLVSYAAIPGRAETYMVEEPENGLHPLAIQAASSALGRPPEGVQLLLATHSPLLLASVALSDTLVFRRSQEGFSVVRRGPEVPELASWSAKSTLADLFVTGVLA
jgi:hypothetical protein